MSKTIVMIVGKTSSGKDTIMRYIKENYGFLDVCSYATRPMRNNETDGVEHHFVSKEKLHEIMETKDIVAYTKFPITEHEYCSTWDDLKGEFNTYIINPDGIRWFEENVDIEELYHYSIYVDLDEETIISRALARGDDIEAIKSRLDSEREDMETFRDNREYDFIVSTREILPVVYGEIDDIMSQILKEVQ